VSDKLNNYENLKLRFSIGGGDSEARACTGNLCTQCVEYICDTYNAGCGL